MVRNVFEEKMCSQSAKHTQQVMCFAHLTSMNIHSIMYGSELTV